MEFENGITATFSLHAQSTNIHRDIHIMCEDGEIWADDEKREIVISRFIGSEAEDVHTRIIKVQTNDSGHGGGDSGIMEDFTASLSAGNTDSRSSISRSVESHLMACAIEEARLSGTVIDMDSYRKKLK